MERGVLFSDRGIPSLQYQKSFCWAETPRSSFWDEEDQDISLHQEVTREKARDYDIFMEIVTEDFY
jgi:hypothetical protein